MTRMVWLLTLMLTVGSVQAAGAGPPTDQMKQYTEHVIRVLEDPALKAPERRHERRAAVRRIAAEVFDVTETAKRALGPHWRGRTPEEQQEFVALFADLLERTYIAQIDLFGGERLRFVGEVVDGDQATVRARVVTKRGVEVPVDARLIRTGDRWLIYDVIIESLSLVGNYRVQFDRIIRTTSFAELMRRLRSRSEFLDEKVTRPRPSS